MKKLISMVLAMLMLLSVVCAAPISISAETATAELISVYFENNWLWTNVFYHSWGSSLDTNTADWGTGVVELVGTSANGHEVYKATIGSDAAGLIFAGTKNDGSGNTDQTPNIETGIVDGACYSMTWDNGNAVVQSDIATVAPDVVVEATEAATEATTEAAATEATETTTEAPATDATEAPAETYTVYFVDYADSFSTVYAYAWTDDNTYDSAWPGKVMTPTGEVLSDGGIVYSCTYDVLYANIIISGTDVDGNYMGQTADLELVVGQYLWWGNEVWYESIDALVAANPDHFNPSTEDEPTTDEPTTETPGTDDVETMRIYFQNNWMWSDINIYYWGSTTAANPEWPGVAMEYADNDGTYDIYYYDVPADITGMIINGTKDDGSGATDQTPDITEGWYDGICYYMTWSDGNAVGSEDISVILPAEEEETAVAEIAGYSISLGGTIGVKFYYRLSDDVAQDSDAKVVFTVPDTGSTYTYEQSIGYAEIVDEFYVFTCYVAAKEMTSKIQAQFVSSIVESEVTEYTVKDYAVYMLQRADIYAAEQDLVKAMLNYGAASQLYFDYNTDNLANNTTVMTDADKEIKAWNLDDFAPVIEGEGTDVKYYGAALVLKSETTLKLFFTYEGTLEEGVSPAVSVNGMTAGLTANGNMYELAFENLAAHQLGTVYNVAFGTGSVDISALGFAYLAQSSSNATLVDLANALAGYYNAVDLYMSE